MKTNLEKIKSSNKRLTLEEKKEKTKKKLDKIQLEIQIKYEKNLKKIFFEIMKDSEIVKILEKNFSNKEFQKKLIQKFKKIILEISNKT